MLSVFVALSARDARLREVHYHEGVGLVLDASLHSEVEPLLVASRVGIHLHEQVVGVLLEAVSLSLEQISRFEDAIEEQNLIAVASLKLRLSLFVTYQVLQQLTGKVFVFTRSEWRQLADVGAGRLVLLFNLLAHDHEVVFFELESVARLILLVYQDLLCVWVLVTRHLNSRFEVALEVR